jgi:hypothetical protein
VWCGWVGLSVVWLGEFECGVGVGALGACGMCLCVAVACVCRCVVCVSVGGWRCLCGLCVCVCVVFPLCVWVWLVCLCVASHTAYTQVQLDVLDRMACLLADYKVFAPQSFFLSLSRCLSFFSPFLDRMARLLADFKVPLSLSLSLSLARARACAASVCVSLSQQLYLTQDEDIHSCARASDNQRLSRLPASRLPPFIPSSFTTTTSSTIFPPGISGCCCSRNGTSLEMIYTCVYACIRIYVYYTHTHTGVAATEMGPCSQGFSTRLLRSTGLSVCGVCGA